MIRQYPHIRPLIRLPNDTCKRAHTKHMHCCATVACAHILHVYKKAIYSFPFYAQRIFSPHQWEGCFPLFLIFNTDAWLFWSIYSYLRNGVINYHSSFSSCIATDSFMLVKSLTYIFFILLFFFFFFCLYLNLIRVQNNGSEKNPCKCV